MSIKDGQTVLGALALLALLVTFATPAVAQVKPAGVSVAVSKGTAQLTFADFAGLPVDLKPFSGAAVITNASILFANTQGEISYLVVQVSGPTLKNGGMRYCGAGEEANLIWIKASHASILDARSILYSSCAFSIEPLDELRPVNGQLRFSYESYSEKRRLACTYDDAVPDRGLSVVSTKQ